MIDSTIACNHDTAKAARSFRKRRAHAVPSSEEMLSATEVLAELKRVFGSADFGASPRNRRVLDYLVSRQLEGRWHELKAYHIATRVYGRPADFNPVKDPIVRIEMAKLRRRLEMYYLKSGSRNPLRIAIPKGGYVPRVTRARQSPGAAEVNCPRLVALLRSALCAWSGDEEGAAAAWRELKQLDPTWPADLQACADRALRDEKVVRLVVEGALRAGRWADSNGAGAPAAD
jgi:hypothetical protein